MAVLRLVELDEICGGGFDLADQDGDREHRLRDGQRGRGSPRALGKNEASEVRSGFGRHRNVLRARQPADLDQRPGQELKELRARVGRPHERRPDQDGIRPSELGSGALGARGDAALGHDHAVPWRAGDQLELTCSVDLERREVAGVHAEDLGVERDRTLELLCVVRLDQDVEAQIVGRGEEESRLTVVQVTQEQERRVGARFLGLDQVVTVPEEPLGEKWDGARGPCRPQVVPRSAEALVDQDRDRCRPGRLVGEGEKPGIGVRAQVAGRRGAPLDLGNRSEARGRERIPEPSHQATASALEKATSSSSRAAAAPESSAAVAIP